MREAKEIIFDLLPYAFQERHQLAELVKEDAHAWTRALADCDETIERAQKFLNSARSN